MKLKVFADLHHFGLFNSLRLLFEKRLGGEIYRPIGEEWLNKGYWRMAEIYNNHPATVAQYLGIRPDYPVESGVYKVWEPQHLYDQKALTLSKFFELPIDVVIASIPEHIESFKRLAAEHPNKPKMVYQIGNAWPVEAGLAPNVMASANILNVPPQINFVKYHQEFDLGIFYFGRPRENKNVYSFINCLNTASIYEKDWQLFQDLEKAMPEWTWRSYGGSCRDGQADGEKAVAEKMRESRFIWHVKWAGDGYGHVLHNSAAVGRPIITNRSYYEGKLGADLMFDGVTCVTIDGLEKDQIINKILYYNENSRYQRLCLDAFDNFKRVVDFDKEEIELKNFLSKLL